MKRRRRIDFWASDATTSTDPAYPMACTHHSMGLERTTGSSHHRAPCSLRRA